MFFTSLTQPRKSAPGRRYRLIPIRTAFFAMDVSFRFMLLCWALVHVDRPDDHLSAWYQPHASPPAVCQHGRHHGATRLKLTSADRSYLTALEARESTR